MRKTVIYSVLIVLFLVFAPVTALHNDVSKANQAEEDEEWVYWENASPYSVVLNDTVYYARLGLYDCEDVGESSTWTVAGYMTDSCPRTSMPTQNGEANFDLSNRDTTIYESSDGLLFIQTREEDRKYDFYGLEEAEDGFRHCT